jgi:uncharacterized repeat protein (TIGR01451 family)
MRNGHNIIGTLKGVFNMKMAKEGFLIPMILMALSLFISAPTRGFSSQNLGPSDSNHYSADTKDRWTAQLNDSRRYDRYGHIPLYFIKNEGQADHKIRFYERGSGHATFFSTDGIYLNLRRGQAETVGDRNEGHPVFNSGSPQQHPQSARIKLSMVGANRNPEIVPEKLQDYTVHYLIGNDPRNWKSNIPTYGTVVYHDVYPGVDIAFHGNNRQLEYDIIVKPGIDPSNVQLAYEGIEGLKITEGGNLEIDLKEGALIQKRPYMYQEINGKKVEVNGKFKLGDPQSDIRDSKFRYSFDITSYDKSRPLIIDPVLVYSTYLGGSLYDDGHGIAVDSLGNAYVTGDTTSAETDVPPFPITAGAFEETYNGGDTDAFVTKINPTGTSLIFSTYLGGTAGDDGRGIAVDGDFNIYLTGFTSSSDFPLHSPVQGTYGGKGDVFVAKLNAAGTDLLYSTYLGGNDMDKAAGIGIDVAGNAYVVGDTQSTNFPTTAGAYDTTCGTDATCNGGKENDAFVTKINATGASWSYSTYLGGSDKDIGNGIAVDGVGNAYVVGETQSTDFDTSAGAFEESFGGGPSDAFVAKINTTGTSLTYSTYLGGGGTDKGRGIAVDSAGNAYVTGLTSSAVPTPFPISSGAYQTTNAGGADAFVTKLNPDATVVPASDQLIYSTYLGGSDDDAGNGIAVDDNGNAFVTGETASSINFPTLSPPAQGFYGGGSNDAFVTQMTASGTSLVYSTYLGGSDDDHGLSIAVDLAGSAYITGQTVSIDFPIISPGIQETFGGGVDRDGFVTKIGLGADLAITKTDSPDPVLAGNNLTYTITVTNSGPDDATNVTVTDPLPGEVTFVSAVGTGWVCNELSGTVTCTRSSLAVGVAPEITIVVTPTSAGEIINTASVASNETDTDVSNNESGPVSTTVNAAADLSITKDDAPDPVVVGDDLTYTITVTNNGPSPATDVTVTDTLPGSVTFVSATPSQGTPCTGTSTVSCNLGTLTNGSNATVMIVVTPNTEGLISNTASVAGNETDPVSGNDTSPPQETTVNPVPSGEPFDGNAFSSGGGSMAATTYQLVPGVIGQSVTGTGLSSTNYQIEAGFVPGVIGGAVNLF